MQLGELDIVVPRIYVTPCQNYIFTIGNNVFNQDHVIRCHQSEKDQMTVFMY